MRTFVVAKRVIKQLAADRRSIGLMFFAPIFVIFLLSVILTSSTSKPMIDFIDAPSQFVTAFEAAVDVKIVNDEETALEDLKNKEADAYIVFEGMTPKITVEGSDPKVVAMINNIMGKALSRLPALMSGETEKTPTITPEMNYLYGAENMSGFDAIAPLFMGFFIFFFVFLLAGVAFLRESISGTLERILATPLRRYEIVFGYFFGFGVFVALQTIVIQLFMMYGLDVVMKGSFWLVLLINIILAGQSLALGTLLSSFAKNEFQLFQFIPIVIVPQILFSGIFDLSEAPQWVFILSKIFPLTYGAEALRDVMIRGLGISDVLPEILILIVYAIVFLILNTLALKKYRRT